MANMRVHELAKELNITDSVATCTLMTEVGEKIYFSAGSPKNIKIISIVLAN